MSWVHGWILLLPSERKKRAHVIFFITFSQSGFVQLENGDYGVEGFLHQVPSELGVLEVLAVVVRFFICWLHKAILRRGPTTWFFFCWIFYLLFKNDSPGLQWSEDLSMCPKAFEYVTFSFHGGSEVPSPVSPVGCHACVCISSFHFYCFVWDWDGMGNWV